MIPKGIIVSIQKYSGSTIQELTDNAIEGGAVAIRTDKPLNCDVPLIALEKLPDRKYYITTTKEAIQFCSWGNYIAIDSRKGNQDLVYLYSFCHVNEYNIIADIEDFYDVATIIDICKKGNIKKPSYFSTTFSFLKNNKHNFDLITQINNYCDIPVIAEGKIKSIDDVKRAFECGASNVCIGAEISDIQYLTNKFSKEV
jgi:putative N-acetylmannosamine-6-phosphate epimerase